VHSPLIVVQQVVRQLPVLGSQLVLQDGPETDSQKPKEQIMPDGHAWPQEPQLELEKDRSTQTPPQSVKEGRQEQTPLRQTLPPIQAFPQKPQLWGLVLGSMQAPLQPVWPGGQQTPPEQL